MNKLKFEIKGLESENDSKKFEDKLAKLKGVFVVKAGHETGRVVIIFEEKVISEKEIVREIKKIGFEIDNKDTSKEKNIDINNKHISLNENFVMGLVTSIGIFSIILNIVLISIIIK